MTEAIRVLGVDPGLARTGWGAVRLEGARLSFIASGVIASGRGGPAERLAAIYEGLAEIAAREAPDAVAVEKTFVNVNAASTLALGQARGAALAALGKFGSPVFEFAPNAVKKAVVGAGHADKRQVQHMIRVLLPAAGAQGADAADALAVAICCAHTHGARLKGHAA